jgi:VCBS repeat-containing protein
MEPFTPISTNSLSSFNGNEDSYQLFAVDMAQFPGVLVEGQNWIAVEVHQVDGFSSDLGLDLAMSAIFIPDAPPAGVLENDVDLEQDPLTAAVVAGPYHGSLTLDALGGFRYTPYAGFSGVDRFTYRASDGLLDSAPGLVTINVGAANVPPMALDDRYLAVFGTYVTAPLGVLANDWDANADDLTVAVEEPPFFGIVTLYPGGDFYYEPELGFTGTDQFEYRVSDGLTSVVAIAIIEVVPYVDVVNVIPRAAADAYTTSEPMLNVAADSGVLVNDRDGESTALSAVVVAATWHGTLTLAPSGSFTYEPYAGFTGTDQFSYKVTDGNTFSKPVAVTIEVLAPPTPTPQYVPGDLDRDGDVDHADIRGAMKLIGQRVGLARYDAAADMDADGRITIGDVVAIRNAAFSAASIPQQSPIATDPPQPALSVGRLSTRRRLLATAVDTVLDKGVSRFDIGGTKRSSARQARRE